MTESRPTLESGHGLERTIFFSDAVIAIAMTLLALELKVPAAAEGKTVFEDFSEKMGHEYLAFLISFAVIAMFWYRHHRLFQHVARLTVRMIILNLTALFAVVLMPFATKLTTDLGDGLAASWGTVFYAGLMWRGGPRQSRAAARAKHRIRERHCLRRAHPSWPTSLDGSSCGTCGAHRPAGYAIWRRAR